MKKVLYYFRSFGQWITKLWYSEKATRLRYRLDNSFVRTDEYLSELIESQNPDRHRHQGQLLPSRSVLLDEHDGFNLCGRGIDKKLSYQGVLINGEAGSFKTSGAIITSILMVQGSQMIHDPSGELYEKSSATLAQKGFRILRLDFSNPTQSIGFNPLSRLQNLSDISGFAHSLVNNNEKDNFWNTKASELLVVVISAVKSLSPHLQTMSNVCYLLDLLQVNHHKEQLDEFFTDYLDTKLFTKYASLMSNSSTTLSSIVSTGQTACQLFDLDENIQYICATDTVGDFSVLRKQPTALFIHTSTAKMNYYSKISSVFFNQFFNSFFDHLPDESDLDMYFHIDEAPVLNINNLDVICSNIRKYRGAVMLVCQNAHSQLESVYGKKSESILANLRTKVYYSCDLPTAQNLEQVLGKYDFEDVQDNDRLKSRSVLTADEIISLPTDKCLIHISGVRPILSAVVPYFQFRDLRELTAQAPYEYNETTNLHAPELIELASLYPNTET